jgi:hypothetical protein
MRRRLGAAIVLAAGLLLLGGPVARASSPCDQLPGNDAGSLAARAACNARQAGAGAVSGVADQVGQAAAGAAELALTDWLAKGGAWMAQGVERQVLSGSTTATLDPSRAGAFDAVYVRVVGVALSLSVLLVLIGIIEAMLTRRPGSLRRVVVGMAVSGIGLGAVPAGTSILVQIVDELSGYVTGGQSQAIGQAMEKLINELQAANPQDPTLAVFAFASLGVMLAGALLWLELAIRGSLIYLFLGVAPLACAAVQWPRLEGVLRQVLFAGLALILSKLVIAISLAVGFAVLASNTGPEALLGGTFILAIAALMPFATARVLPLAAEEMASMHQGRVRGWAVGGATTVVRTGMNAAGWGAAALGSVGPRPAAQHSSSPARRGEAQPVGLAAPNGQREPGAPPSRAQIQQPPRATTRSPEHPASAPQPGTTDTATPPRPPRGPEPPRDGTPPPTR